MDVTTRTETRQALLAYMREHQIGAPTLAKRIEEATPRHPEIQSRTLTRFLAGKMRTNDQFVSICARYVEKMKLTVPADTLGKALFALTRGRPMPKPDGFSLSDATGFEVVDHHTHWTLKATFSGPHAVFHGTAVMADGLMSMVMFDALTGAQNSSLLAQDQHDWVGSRMSGESGKVAVATGSLSRSGK